MTGLVVQDAREPLPEAFLELPRIVYKDDPCWIPEERDVVAKAFDPASPWFRTGRAITATLPGQSRAAGFLPGIQVEGKRAAFFGYWESAGDASGDAAVLGAIEAWAAEQGAEVLFGPIDFSTFGRYRLRLGAEPGTVPFPGEPYNPPHYPARLEELGYRLHQTYLSQVGPAPRGRQAEKEPRLKALLDQGYRIEPLRPEVWLRALPELHRLIDTIFGANFAYTPLGYGDFERMVGVPTAQRMCPQTSVIAYAPGGDIAGFVHIYPHYGPLAVQGAGADRVPASQLAYRDHFPKLQRMGPVGAVARTAGVAPAHRCSGVMDALGVAALELGAGRYAHWQAALIRADNPSRNFARGVAAHERWYGLYAKDLPARAS